MPLAAELVKLEAALTWSTRSPPFATRCHQRKARSKPGERYAGNIANSSRSRASRVLQALRLLKRDGFVLSWRLAPAPGAVACWWRRWTAWMVKVSRCAGRSTRWPRGWPPPAVQLDPRLIRQGRKAAREERSRAMIDADMAFHSAIYAASANPLIEQSALQHWRHLRRVGARCCSSRASAKAVGRHEAIADAIAAGDADRAALFIEQHSQRAGDNLAAQLTQVLQSTEGDKR